jgi:hypothetical protein
MAIHIKADSMEEAKKIFCNHPSVLRAAKASKISWDKIYAGKPAFTHPGKIGKTTIKQQVKNLLKRARPRQLQNGDYSFRW